MIEWNQILPFDNKLRELVNFPCSLSFVFLGLGTGNGWKFFGFAVLGIIVSSYIWWLLYKAMILNGSVKNRGKFYMTIIPVQILTGSTIITIAVIAYAP